eukprot:232484-Chlamydomonas_euryale.AAC.2
MQSGSTSLRPGHPLLPCAVLVNSPVRSPTSQHLCRGSAVSASTCGRTWQPGAETPPIKAADREEDGDGVPLLGPSAHP